MSIYLSIYLVSCVSIYVYQFLSGVSIFSLSEACCLSFACLVVDSDDSDTRTEKLNTGVMLSPNISRGGRGR